MDGLRAADCEQRTCSADLILLRDKHRVLKSRFRGVGVVSAILRNLSRDLGLGIAVMTIVRSFSKAIWRESDLISIASSNRVFGELGWFRQSCGTFRGISA